METSELLRRAWEAVEESGVPEPMKEAAFREAVEHLRSTEEPKPEDAAARAPRGKTTGEKSTPKTAPGNAGAPVDEDTFFSRLSDESGVSEKDLRDVLSLAGQDVHVTQPTRNLGTSRAEQARTVIALVAGARAVGLDERPVDAGPVRRELERKHCYDSDNFAGKHLGELDGFNAGRKRTEIVTTSKWVGEFAAAVNQALGRTKDSETEQKG